MHITSVSIQDVAVCFILVTCAKIQCTIHDNNITIIIILTLTIVAIIMIITAVILIITALTFIIRIILNSKLRANSTDILSDSTPIPANNFHHQNYLEQQLKKEGNIMQASTIKVGKTLLYKQTPFLISLPLIWLILFPQPPLLLLQSQLAPNNTILPPLPIAK